MTPSELQDFYDYTIEEVAQEMGISITTVSRAQQSGLAKVIKILEKHGITAEKILED